MGDQTRLLAELEEVSKGGLPRRNKLDRKKISRDQTNTHNNYSLDQDSSNCPLKVVWRRQGHFSMLPTIEGGNPICELSGLIISNV